jgi:hypothetical protein
MINQFRNHPIIGFVADLMFITRVDNVAESMSIPVRWIERMDQIASPDFDPVPNQFGEHLHGPGAILIDELTDMQPSLIIFDLSNPQIPWRDWIALIKSVPATRRLPVLCFGSHKDVDAIRAARDAGADVVLARSRFVQELPRLIEQFAHLPDYQGINQACEQPLSVLAIKGLELFNQAEYFEAHEVLEEAWNEDATPGRELYRAILQVAVAYLQIERGNYNGAMKMFLRVRQWIRPLPDVCRGVDVGRLREDAYQVHQMLSGLGKERIAEFDVTQFHPIHYRVRP